ncbi:uncharacterized protein LOC131850106 [Achroia grisella]|uniref:uncharacterized protein LOC131850106 n=1 Tax=Achroia grisella TaxID=688607 RepID=UPI0027D2F2D0|nr:uncharacterized protein LOC131850106 [Achroia grisella]
MSHIDFMYEFKTSSTHGRQLPPSSSSQLPPLAHTQPTQQTRLEPTPVPIETTTGGDKESLCTLSSSIHEQPYVTEVLATAKVFATARNGSDVVIRCLLDPGSQKHYITSKCCLKLGLTMQPDAHTTVKGIGGATEPVKGNLPTCQIDVGALSYLTNIPLADDTWGTPSEIDLLIGVNLFATLLSGDNLLRVGGRLTHSDEDFDYKHPILLPGRDHIVQLIVTHFHRKNLHTGPEWLMSILRTKYWILAARRMIRTIVANCNICFRNKPRPTFPPMGDLPALRVKEVPKAFVHCGCDFAGPFFVTPYRGRGITTRKAYVCLFTCLTTRAVHIELASELSTVCFLAALKRFLARRGPIQCMYTDHGTNFIGARSYLRELYLFLSQECRSVWDKELANNGIKWTLIPPNAPHFGGCWESNIKCVKSHLSKVIGLQILTFEELTTVLTQIESLLNSRPLTVLSSDPSDLEALTPAHFLNTIPLKHFPAHDVSDTIPHLLKRHELLDQLVQSFWKRWHREYLHTLQLRRKWNTPAFPIQEGTIVVVMQENLTPLHWPLGLITRVYKGKDGIIRVASVKTKAGIFQRPVVKLCPLPLQ